MKKRRAVTDLTRLAPHHSLEPGVHQPHAREVAARVAPCSGTFVASAWLEDARVAAVFACQYAEKRSLFNPSAKNLTLSAAVRRVG